MLRKLFLSAAVAFLLTPALLAQTVDEIIAKNIEARGGLDKIKAVQSMRSSGKMEFGPGMEAPGVMIQKRPSYVRLDFTVQGLTATQAYDGKSGWAIMPFTGKKDPEAMSADDTKDFEDEADLDGPLVDYKSKGHQVELLGKEKVEGTDAYKVKLTRKNGDVDIIYVDADSFLEIKEEQTRTIRGTERESETTLGDYREVNGLMFPFAVASSIKGSPQQQKLTIEKIELNLPLDDASFKMPAAAPVLADKPDAAKPADKPKN
ncbi:MAG: outer membrane lipoprotein-sorting protein [Acidobacteriia bacterium]|nr:outer membrane lipoprotein-sorting protein [Terriglobia bacterium]